MCVGWVDSVVVTCLAAFDKPKLFLSPPSFPHSLTRSLVRTNFPRAKQVLHLGSASLPTILILIVISTDWEIDFNIQRKAF